MRDDAFNESGGGCLSCDPHCEICRRTECVHSINSWYPVKDNCSECTKLSNCAQCANTQAYCVGCVDAGLASKDGVCTACAVNNCVECPSDARQCQTCQQGYFLISETNCQQFDETCPNLNRDTRACEFCPDGRTSTKRNASSVHSIAPCVRVHRSVLSVPVDFSFKVSSVLVFHFDTAHPQTAPTSGRSARRAPEMGAQRVEGKLSTVNVSTAATLSTT